MTLIRAIAFLLHFTLVPVAMGRLITNKQDKEKRDSAGCTYVIGLFGSFAVFYVLCSLLEWNQYWNTFTEPFTGSFTALCWIYSVVAVIIVLIWIKKDLPAIKTCKSYWHRRIKACLYDFKANRLLGVYLLILIAVLAVQLYFSFAYEINEWSYDDYDYVVSSQDTISKDAIAYTNFITGEMPFTNTKRAVASWTTYIAYLAKVSGFEVTTICHTILPVILLVIAYLAYHHIAGFLFKESENRLIFLILLASAYMFGNYSHYSNTFRLLGTIWQGKAVLYAIAIPFFMIYLFEAYKEEHVKGKSLPMAMISLGACSLTSMSILLVSTTAIGIWFVMNFYHRKIQGIKYLIASLVGPIVLIIYYVLFSMLIEDMMTDGDVFFSRNREKTWWYRWFG